MTITISGVNITLPNGFVQSTGRFRSLDANTSQTASDYALGTYLLIDLQINASPTYPIPLDGWSSGPSGPATPSAITNAQTGTVLQLNRYTTFNPGATVAGVWYSRGSSLFQALIVRVA